MVSPTFLCIGVQKGGTTSLINYLNQNSEIYMSVDEKHFFDRGLLSGELTNKDIKDYEDSFKTNKLIVGEKTPSYNYLQYAMDRIYNYNPNIKLILILREPISRAFSEYNMELNNNNKDLNSVTEEKILDFFEREKEYNLSEIKDNGGYYIVRGYYDEILEYILSKFKRENIYIGISEEIKNNKYRIYNEIYEFLGAQRLDTIQNDDVHIRIYKKTIPKKLELDLYNIYKSHNERLYKILGRKIKIWEDYYNKIIFD